ncbi:MAG TPA: YciI family protein [Actinomycetota bacterium]
MQYVVMAWDGTDEGARDRRLATRPRHLERIEPFVDSGHALVGGAILDDGGGMIGSVMVMDFDTRDALDDWLRNDPYTTEGVWERVDVRPYRAAVGAWMPED